MEAKERIIVALDVNTSDDALLLVDQLRPHVGYFKIGLQFITSMVTSLANATVGTESAIGRRIRYFFEMTKEQIFWDGKFDDIPNTVAGASEEVAKIGVRMFNLHASAGSEAIAKAVENRGDSLVLGVTVLTSISDECISIFGDKPGNKVVQFAQMLSDQKADGIICSAKELPLLSGTSLLKVTPGIRPKWAQANDQKRVMTPYEAIMAGADYLVIGRPIIKPPEPFIPVTAAQDIAKEIEKALQEKGN